MGVSWGAVTLFQEFISLCELELFCEFSLLSMRSLSSVNFTSLVKSSKSEIHKLWAVCKLWEICGLHSRCPAVQLVIGQWEKFYCVSLVLHILLCCCFCFCYYYLLICCLIKLFLSLPPSFTFCPFSSPSHCKGKKERASSSMVLVASCQVKPRQAILTQDSLGHNSLDYYCHSLFLSLISKKCPLNDRNIILVWRLINVHRFLLIQQWLPFGRIYQQNILYRKLSICVI